MRFNVSARGQSSPSGKFLTENPNTLYDGPPRAIELFRPVEQLPAFGICVKNGVFSSCLSRPFKGDRVFPTSRTTSGVRYLRSKVACFPAVYPVRLSCV
ncbi:hypothetical protein Vi05172_g8209 [Venturia inaequalis]|nr:hypothetical protein Vi05172_g8209 [Venturia inaequalis]